VAIEGTPTPASEAPVVTPPAEAPAAPPSGDSDDIALHEAREAAKAEEAAAGGKAQEEAVKEVSPQPEPGTETPAKPPRITIPKARLDEALNETKVERAAREKAEQAAAYWRGAAEARATPTATPTPQATPQDRLAAIDTQIDTLAARFDAGEITMADYKREERTLTRMSDAIREEALVAKVNKPAPAPAKADGPDASELWLEDRTIEIEQEHPWVPLFDQLGTETDWAYLKGLAIERLVAKNIDPASGPRGRLALRQEAAILADEIGPVLLAQRAKAKGIALPGPTSPPPAGTKPPMSPTALARKDKLALAANAPPDVTSIPGSAAPNDLAALASKIDGTADPEEAADLYAKLPASTRQRLLLGTTG